MKTREEKNDEPLKAVIEKIKSEFRKWYGMISPEELASNRELTFFILQFEQRMAKGF